MIFSSTWYLCGVAGPTVVRGCDPDEPFVAFHALIFPPFSLPLGCSMAVGGMDGGQLRSRRGRGAEGDAEPWDRQPELAWRDEGDRARLLVEGSFQ